jgi:hypothetical protein
MQSLFEPPAKSQILRRLSDLSPSAERQWGKMSASQMLAHCAAALEVGTGDRPRPQALIGKIFGPFVRKGLLGDKPFSKGSPTDPTFVVTDERNFVGERQRLIALVEKFSARGRDEAGRQTHSFFGRMTGDEWGRLMYKHLDHHLRQFGG